MGIRTWSDAEEFKADYASGSVHPGDLKAALAKALNQILQVGTGNWFSFKGFFKDFFKDFFRVC